MAGTLIEGTAALVKGILDPTLPLKAMLKPIKDVDVPQAHHTVSVVKGRAHLFDGKMTSRDGRIELADNNYHVVVLPTSGVESSDCLRVDGKGAKPPRRWGHSAAVIAD